MFLEKRGLVGVENQRGKGREGGALTGEGESGAMASMKKGDFTRRA